MIKAAVYFVLNILFIPLVYFLGISMFNDNSHQEGCQEDIRHLGKELGSFFNWAFEDEPCRFTTEFTICFYIYLFIFYAGLKTYAKHCYKSALTLKFIAVEMLVYFALYYGLVIYNMIGNGIELSWISLSNAFLGCLYFSVPMIVFGAVIVGAHVHEPK